MIYLAAGTLEWKYGTLAVGLYIMLGTLGMPVFTNFEGGFHKIAGVTGGYIIGYIPCALATGFTVKIFKKHQWSYIFGMVIGTVLLYTCGTIWFVVQTGNSLAVSLTLCVTPFLIGDTIKIILAYIIAPQLRKALAYQVES
jgi:biotin transport system substrate-specific component